MLLRGCSTVRGCARLSKLSWSATGRRWGLPSGDPHWKHSSSSAISIDLLQKTCRYSNGGKRILVDGRLTWRGAILFAGLKVGGGGQRVTCTGSGNGREKLNYTSAGRTACILRRGPVAAVGIGSPVFSVSGSSFTFADRSSLQVVRCKSATWPDGGGSPVGRQFFPGTKAIRCSSSDYVNETEHVTNGGGQGRVEKGIFGVEGIGGGVGGGQEGKNKIDLRLDLDLLGKVAGEEPPPAEAAAEVKVKVIGGGEGRERERAAMTSVSRKNFEESLSEVVKLIGESDFIGMDLEMSGVETAKWRRNIEVDTCETRYLNVKNSAESFAALQVGVCPFKWDDAKSRYVAHPFNFYLFPRSVLERDTPSRVFLCQVSSMEFLAEHKFDFNKCVYEGISYLSEAQEMEARSQFEHQERQRACAAEGEKTGEEIPLTRSADILFTESVGTCVGRWRDKLLLKMQQGWQWTEEDGGHWVGRRTDRDDDGDGGDGGVSTNTVSATAAAGQGSSINSSKSREREREGEFVVESESSHGSLSAVVVEEAYLGVPSILLGPFSQMHSNLARQAVRRRFKDMFSVMVLAEDSEKKSNDDGGLYSAKHLLRVVYMRSKDDKKKLQEKLKKEREQKHEARMHAAVGFRHVIDAISDSQRLVVVHNGFLDLAHIHSKFIGPLPARAEKFCAGIHRKFPHIADTKFLLKAYPQLRGSLGRKSTNLSKVYSQIVKAAAAAATQGGLARAPIAGGDGGRNVSLYNNRSSDDKLKVVFAQGFDRYLEGSNKEDTFYHEAGFDAYMTGIVFVHACHIIGASIADIRAALISPPPPCPNMLMMPTSSSIRRSPPPPPSELVSPPSRSLSQTDNGFVNQSQQQQQQQQQIYDGHLRQNKATKQNSPPPLDRHKKNLGNYFNVVITGWIGSMTLDLASGKEGLGIGRSLPDNGRFKMMYPNRTNVVLVWRFPPLLGGEMLRKTIAGIFARPPTVNLFFIDASSALVQFHRDSIADIFLDLVAHCRKGVGMTKGATAFIGMGIQAAPFPFYEELCKSHGVGTDLTEAAESLLRDRRWDAKQLWRNDKMVEEDEEKKKSRRQEQAIDPQRIHRKRSHAQAGHHHNHDDDDDDDGMNAKTGSLIEEQAITKRAAFPSDDNAAGDDEEDAKKRKVPFGELRDAGASEEEGIEREEGDVRRVGQEFDSVSKEEPLGTGTTGDLCAAAAHES